MDDLAKRLRNRVQLSSDGHKAYLIAVEEAFGGDVDYAMIVKEYGTSDARPPALPRHRERRGSSCRARQTGIRSYAERSNLTLRMSMRRFTRLTNGFSKKLENHALMVSLFTMYNNFCRPHKTLVHKTPAMAAVLTDRVWKMEDLIAIIDERTPAPEKPGPKPKGRPAPLM